MQDFCYILKKVWNGKMGKKKSSPIISILITIIILAGLTTIGYLYLKTDTFIKKTDMSESPSVGTWMAAGSWSDDSSYFFIDETTNYEDCVARVELYPNGTCMIVTQHLRDEGREDLKMSFADTSSTEYGSWSEDEEKVTLKPNSGLGFRTYNLYKHQTVDGVRSIGVENGIAVVEGIYGITPQTYGYASDYFMCDEFRDAKKGILQGFIYGKKE